jgi:3alpha(or 20beta)-hydroxysteroid dehydrogenase
MADHTAALTGRVALVTGAAHGIGAATARHLHELGFHVVLMDLSVTGAEKLRTDLGVGSLAVGGDVSAPTAVAAAVEAAVDAFGGLDVLVNNAATGSSARVDELDPADWKQVLDVNLGGVLNGIKHAAPVMRERGGGSIINLSSVAARHAMYAMSAYAAAKAAVEAVTRCAAVELRPDGIRVNAVAPGMIRSRAAERTVPILDRAIPPSFDDFITHRQGRWGEPAEIASVIAHLAGDGSSFVTGQTLVVDHGASLLL